VTASGYNKDLIRIQNENFLKNRRANAFIGIKVVQNVNYFFNTTMLYPQSNFNRLLKIFLTPILKIQTLL
jgi:hypothetical protein